MGDMTPLFSLFALIPLILSGFVLYAHQRTHGSLDVTTSSVAYNRTRNEDILAWDKHAISIQGMPTRIFSAEFHYWRVPDRSRWEPILKQFISMGMNTIRIYFHWGYHSPNDGVYLFDGNRDVDYLLDLCEKLDLYVLAAPGPYICAETQGGGYPPWLIAKRELKIRHNHIMLWRTYDSEFAAYEIQWLENILPFIVKHQVTNRQREQKGCVIGLQIDNELFETLKGILPVGLRDQMRVLAKASRDLGVTIPLFTNDGFEEGGWIPYLKEDKKEGFWSGSTFGLDWYGFDKYVVLAPSSSPKSWLVNKGLDAHAWEVWNPSTVENSMDKLEKTVRGYGGGADRHPILLPELQGGWFNHYLLQHTYDDIYNFYGPDYTKTITETALAQGVSILSLYMVYGGTNWGTLGDPDVYTSYDYSACIREFGFLSERGRNMRKTILFARTFDPYFTKTDPVAHPNVKSSVPNTINLQRVAAGNTDQLVEFTFLRNFDRKERSEFILSVTSSEGDSKNVINLPCHLPYKQSFIALGNYHVANGLHLIMSSIPIYARIVNEYSQDEVWIIGPNNIGGMAFLHKDFQLSGNMQNDILRRDGIASILMFEKTDGWAKLTTSNGHLYLIGLDSYKAGTLFGHFDEAYWNKGQKHLPLLLAWGADSIYFDHKNEKFELQYGKQDSELHVVSFRPPKHAGEWQSDKGSYAGVPVHYATEIQRNAQFPLPVDISFNKWLIRNVNFSSFPWHPLHTVDGASQPTWDAIDYGYTSGHVLYRTSFLTPPTERPHVTLSLNARHRATVILNGRVIGGHTTYSRQLFHAGAKIGPDPWFLGTHSYDLSPFLTTEDGTNDLVILVDSFGLNRQAFIMNDIRNPRGIIKVKLSGLERAERKRAMERWQLTGVDVRNISNSFNTTGFPDEGQPDGWGNFKDISHSNGVYHVPVLAEHGARWLQFRFDCPIKSSQSSLLVPLRLRLDGQWTAKVFVNDILIALYYGNGDSPQHDFYLPDDLVLARGNVVKMLVYSWVNTTGEISIRGWPVEENSGNLVLDGDSPRQEYMRWKEEKVW